MSNLEGYKTIPVKVGKLIIGGGHPVTVQSMWKAPLSQVDGVLVGQVNSLFEAGCDLLRFAVPDTDCADRLGELAGKVPHPLVADIHFDYRIGLKCLDYPIAKIRINPGNIGKAWKVEEIVKKAGDKNVPIRVGINGGSLPKSLRNEPDLPAAMMKAAEMELEILENLGFKNVVFSLKSSDVFDTIKANELFAARYNYPLHLGVTEAGPLRQGLIKSTIAFYSLLSRGIGDTLRISLSDSPLNEVLAAKEFLNIMKIGKEGVNLISCPTCGRTSFDVKEFLPQIQPYLNKIDKKVTIAVMGCPVNGPGEAKHADLGITGSGKHVAIFKKGEIIHKILPSEALETFLKELEQIG